MIGEIRDQETAEIAIEAAMTGHLVLSTLHTIDSASAIGRLMDLGVEPRRFADALHLILAQRLIRLNCSECAKPYKPRQADLSALHIEEEIQALKGTGCDLCRQTGFFGRMGLYEVLAPDSEMRDMIERQCTAGDIRRTAQQKGMRTLREAGIAVAKEGKTTIEEVLRVTA
jgi:type II secretory ATPase GspE/PulE/Tfp pilus assembly ATPase PilB-like protein